VGGQRPLINETNAQAKIPPNRELECYALYKAGRRRRPLIASATRLARAREQLW